MVAYIFPTLQPCRDHQECFNRVHIHRQQMVQAIQQGQILLRQFRTYSPVSITAEDAIVEMITQCGFSYREIVQVVRTTESILVEWHEGMQEQSSVQSTYASTIFILARSGPSHQPLHVICGYQSRPRNGRNWEIPILGAYDPSAEDGKWSDDYTSRLCFCTIDRTSDERERRTQAYASNPWKDSPYARNQRADKERQRYYTLRDAQ